MTAKGTIKVEDELKNSWWCSVKYRQCIPYAGGGKGKKKKKEALKNSRSLRTYGNYVIPQHFLETKKGKKRRAWTEKNDKS